MEHKLKKLSPSFKKKAITAGQIAAIAGMMSLGVLFNKEDTRFRQYKIIKPHALAVESAINTFQHTTLKLNWVDNEHISVNDEILINEDAIAKYPHERKAITAFVQYHWYLQEQKLKAENNHTLER